jgi:hypothetical protein
MTLAPAGNQQGLPTESIFTSSPCIHEIPTALPNCHHSVLDVETTTIHQAFESSSSEDKTDSDPSHVGDSDYDPLRSPKKKVKVVGS